MKNITLFAQVAKSKALSQCVLYETHNEIIAKCDPTKQRWNRETSLLIDLQIAFDDRIAEIRKQGGAV